MNKATSLFLCAIFIMGNALSLEAIRNQNKAHKISEQDRITLKKMLTKHNKEIDTLFDTLEGFKIICTIALAAGFVAIAIGTVIFSFTGIWGAVPALSKPFRALVQDYQSALLQYLQSWQLQYEKEMAQQEKEIIKIKKRNNIV